MRGLALASLSLLLASGCKVDDPKYMLPDGPDADVGPDADPNAPDADPSAPDARPPRCTVTTWQVETVDSNGNVGRYSSVGFDSDNTIYISYSDADADALKLAQRSVGSSTWTIATIDDPTNNVGLGTALAVDPNDGIHIAYNDETAKDLKYAYRAAGGSWAFQTPDTAGGSEPSIAILNGRVHVAYKDDESGIAGELYHRYKPIGGTTWIGGVLTTSSNVRRPRMAMDANERIHVGYVLQSTSELGYATDQSGSWLFSMLAAAAFINDPAIRVGPDGRIHMVYRQNDTVAHAHKTPTGTWQFETVDGSIAGFESSLVFDASGGLHVSYRDNALNNLLYAYRPATGDWSTPEVVYDFGSTGFETSIGVDPLGDVHVTFYSSTGTQLEHAYLCREQG